LLQYGSIFIRLAVIASETREISRKFDLQQFRVIQGYRSWCQWKAHIWLSHCNCSRICYRFRDIYAYR